MSFFDIKDGHKKGGKYINMGIKLCQNCSCVSWSADFILLWIDNSDVEVNYLVTMANMEIYGFLQQFKLLHDAGFEASLNRKTKHKYDMHEFLSNADLHQNVIEC